MKQEKREAKAVIKNIIERDKNNNESYSYPNKDGYELMYSMIRDSVRNMH